MTNYDLPPASQSIAAVALVEISILIAIVVLAHAIFG